MKPLDPPDIHHLNAAEGWLKFGNTHEANEELEKIEPRLRSHPEVLAIRLQIYAHARNWEACLELAEAVVKLAPEHSDGWIHRSFTLHELKRTREAFDQLLPAVERFDRPIIRGLARHQRPCHASARRSPSFHGKTI